MMSSVPERSPARMKDRAVVALERHRPGQNSNIHTDTDIVQPFRIPTWAATLRPPVGVATVVKVLPGDIWLRR